MMHHFPRRPFSCALLNVLPRRTFSSQPNKSSALVNTTASTSTSNPTTTPTSTINNVQKPQVMRKKALSFLLPVQSSVVSSATLNQSPFSAHKVPSSIGFLNHSSGVSFFRQSPSLSQHQLKLKERQLSRGEISSFMATTGSYGLGELYASIAPNMTDQVIQTNTKMSPMMIFSAYSMKHPPPPFGPESALIPVSQSSSSYRIPADATSLLSRSDDDDDDDDVTDDEDDDDDYVSDEDDDDDDDYSDDDEDDDDDQSDVDDYEDDNDYPDDDEDEDEEYGGSDEDDDYSDDGEYEEEEGEDQDDGEYDDDDEGSDIDDEEEEGGSGSDEDK